jgi:hypothetical protein
MDSSGILLAAPLVALSLAAFLLTLRNRAFSALYWFCLLAVFVVPALLDVLFGLPALAWLGVFRVYNPDAEQGIHRALLFALGHVGVTAAVYFPLARRLPAEGDAAHRGAFGRWMRRSPSLVPVLALCFLAAAAAVFAFRGDLTRQFNDFLEADARPQYETYLLLAASPLTALLLEKGRAGRAAGWLLGAASVVVAYFIGIRYYMFPYLGYMVWMAIVHVRAGIVAKVAVLLLVASTAWLLLTAWGVVRGLGLRDNPTAVLDYYDPVAAREAALAGNELAARLAYYDLMVRMEKTPEFSGFQAVTATLLAAPYPMLLRPLGIETPLSNSKRVYDLQSGTRGTGISTGTTVFGNEWFTWGWWGIPIGGIGMGALLALVDLLHRRRGAAWMLLGPMATYQLIFFARGGTDVWLGLWGRFLPLTAVAVAAALVADNLLAIVRRGAGDVRDGEDGAWSR